MTNQTVLNSVTTTLGEICLPKQHPTISADQLQEAGYPVYGANGQIGFYSTYTHATPTIAVTCRGATCGTIHIVPAFSYITGNAMALDNLNEEKVDLSYLAWCLRARGFHDVISGSAQPQITRQPLQNIRLTLPPLDEQRRIATILDQADDLRRKRRLALEKLSDLPQAIFHEMFGDPIENPHSYPVASLTKLGRVSTGGTPPTGAEGLFGGNIPFVTPGDLDNGAPVRRTVTEAGAAAVGTVRRGSALVCCIGATIGKMDMARDRCAFNQQINAVEWSPSIDDTFGFYALTFLRHSIASSGASTTMPILKKSRFEQITLPLPPAEEQHIFARRAAQVSKLKSMQRIHLATLDQLFASLMEDAFRAEG